jgi:hypothetical protein
MNLLRTARLDLGPSSDSHNVHHVSLGQTTSTLVACYRVSSERGGALDCWYDLYAAN